MNLDLEAVAKTLGGLFVLIIVISVALYTALKVLRSDHTYTQLITTLENQLVQANARADAADARTAVRIDQVEADAKRERDELRREIENLRRTLQGYTMRRSQ